MSQLWHRCSSRRATLERFIVKATGDVFLLSLAIPPTSPIDQKAILATTVMTATTEQSQSMSMLSGENLQRRKSRESHRFNRRVDVDR